ANDTGTSSVDLLTNDGQVTVTGTVADANGVASLVVNDGAESHTVPVAAHRSWSHALDLAEGSHALEVLTTDNAGNLSSQTLDAITVIYTRSLHDALPIFANDTGTSSVDLLTNDGQVTVTGTVADANGVASLVVNDGAESH